MALIKSVALFGGLAFGAVGTVESASFELDGSRGINFMHLSSAFGAYCHRLVIEILILAKFVPAVAAFISVNWQIILPSVLCAFKTTTR